MAKQKYYIAKQKYYIAPSKYFYDYTIEGTCQISLVSSKGIYVWAFSLKQAVIYIKRRIAISQMRDIYDIEIDTGDIELITE